MFTIKPFTIKPLIVLLARNANNYSAKSSVLKMFRQCGVEGLSSVADNIVSAHVVGTNGAHPAVRVVMSNHWIVNEVLTVARQLKTTTYSHVQCTYLKTEP